MAVSLKTVLAACQDAFAENVETKLRSFAKEFMKEIADEASALEILDLMPGGRMSSSSLEGYKLLILHYSWHS